METKKNSTDELDIKRYLIDPYSQISGIRTGLMMAREWCTDEVFKKKLSEGITEVSKQLVDMRKNYARKDS